MGDESEILTKQFEPAGLTLGQETGRVQRHLKLWRRSKQETGKYFLFPAPGEGELKILEMIAESDHISVTKIVDLEENIFCVFLSMFT